VNGGGVVSFGHNLADDASCAAAFTETTDRSAIPAGLDGTVPQDHGGPTKTIALLAGSPALDAVPAADCADAAGEALAVDQRGMDRPVGSGCDAGAYEGSK
jgi:hypothetical protein